MQAIIKRNKLIRSKFQKLELNNYINSAITKSNIIASKTITTLHIEQKDIVYKSKIRNICAITGRSRAVFNNYKVSRIQLKKLAESGNIPGLRKV